MAKYIDMLEKKLTGFMKKAKKRKKNAKKAKIACYFEGQQDAFEKVLMELRILKYELETHGKDEDEGGAIPPKAEEVAAPAEEGEDLLRKALETGVITQKISLYLHEDFPGGKVRGKKRVFDLLDDEHLAEKIRRQIAETRA